MKSKLTSILMFFIILAIIFATGIIGIIIFQDIFGINILNPESQQEAEYYENEGILYTSEENIYTNDSSNGIT